MTAAALNAPRAEVSPSSVFAALLRRDMRVARRELPFKLYQRRHQLPTQVWYKAYPGLTLIDLTRNARIRQGLEQSRMSDGEALAWLRLL